MFDSTNKNRSCAHAPDAAAYVYEELKGKELAKFESHLEACDSCPQDISSFAAIAGEIGNWKAAEFDKLDTPNMIAGINEIRVNSERGNQTVSFGNRIKSILGGRGLIWQAASVCALLVVALGLVWFLMPVEGNDNLRASESVPPVDKEVVTEKPADQANLVDQDELVIDEVEAPVVSPPEVPAVRSRKVLRVNRTKTPPVQRVRTTRKVEPRTVKSPVAPKVDPAIQRLTELAVDVADPDEDDELRLTELFAVAETDEEK